MEDLVYIQDGGEKIFTNQQILYIVATITDSKLKKQVNRLTNIILGKNNKPYRQPHITLFHLIINSDNPDSDIFQKPSFYNKIAKIYKNTLANSKDSLILKALQFPRDYSLAGYRPRHFIKNYKPVNYQKILDFRNDIYDLIETYLGEEVKITNYQPQNSYVKYKIYSYHKKNKELFAIEHHHYATWKPHLNFLNDFDINSKNEDLSREITRYSTNIERVDILVEEIEYNNIVMDDIIDMSKHMREVTYSVKEDHGEQIVLKKFNI